MAELKRLKFFTGFFTTAEDWKAEQNYHLEKRRLLNRGLHTPGVLRLPGEPEPESLEVEPVWGALRVSVQPGAAVDAAGREIYLAQAEEVDLLPTQDGKEVADVNGNREVYVAVRYREVPDEFVEYVDTPAYNDFTRTAERPELESWGARPTNKEWLELARVRIAADADSVSAEDIDRDGVLWAAAVVDPAGLEDLQLQLDHLQQTVDAGHADLQLRLEGLGSRDRLHNRTLHTPGILEGLKVVSSQTGGLAVEVEPGAALDATGREIVLATQSPPQGLPANSGAADVFRFLVVRWAEEDGLPENAELEVLAAPPADGVSEVLARIRLRPGATEVTADDVDQTETSGRRWAGSRRAATISAPDRDRLVGAMGSTREHFGALGNRYPTSAADDTRHAALTLKIVAAGSELHPEHVALALGALADVELDVEQAVAAQYPALATTTAFAEYRGAVKELHAALATASGLGDLLTKQETVAYWAGELAQTVPRPPDAFAGEDQTVEAVSGEASVELDASGSKVYGGRSIEAYGWSVAHADMPPVADLEVDVAAPITVRTAGDEAVVTLDARGSRASAGTRIALYRWAAGRIDTPPVPPD